MEKRQRGRPPKIKESNIKTFNIDMEGNSVTEKLKVFASQLLVIDRTLNIEPYRIELRTQKQDIIEKICFLIEKL
jgi:hypothetical protein